VLAHLHCRGQADAGTAQSGGGVAMTLLYNKYTYESARRQYGIKDSVFVDGQEFAQIPKEPFALLFWLSDRIAKPIFNDAGELIDWKVVDLVTRDKYITLVEETARANGYELPNLREVLT
jgi:hypothetical protein